MFPRIWDAPCSGPYQDRTLGVGGKRLGMKHLGCEEELGLVLRTLETREAGSGLQGRRGQSGGASGSGEGTDGWALQQLSCSLLSVRLGPFKDEKGQETKA